MADVGYSKKVMDHFMNPKNVGTIEDADGYGKVGNPVCGDLMEIFIKVKNDVINDIKFRTFGCGSAIATSSMVTELAKGKNIDEAMKITRGDVASELDKVNDSIQETLTVTKFSSEPPIIQPSKTPAGQEILKEVNAVLEQKITDQLPEPPVSAYFAKRSPTWRVPPSVGKSNVST